MAFTTLVVTLIILPAALLAETPPPTAPPPPTTTATTEQAPSGVEVEIGMGSRIGRDVSNYQIDSGVLSLTNIGRATPQLLTGLGFSFCEEGSSSSPPNKFCNNALGKKLGVFVSAQFGSGSNQTISGYSIGGTLKLGAHLRFLAGFSEMPIGEVSPGFANAAAQYVTKNPGLFTGINPATLALGGSAPLGAFDGIQTTGTAPASGAAATAGIYYPGSVTETHYRGGLIIGVALPINIFNLFKGNGK